MDLNKYREIIDEFVSAKSLEQDTQKKKELENFENGLRQNLRTIEIQDRLQNLYYAERFIEYMCLLSQYIEFKIKEIIINSRQLALLLSKQFIDTKDLEEKTLGALIDIFDKHCIDDDNLVMKLRKFNKLRIKAIHKLFDIKYEIKDIENEIDKNFNLIAYLREIINPLGYYLYKITLKIVGAKEKNGAMPQYAKTVINKISIKMEELNPSLKDKNIEKNIKL